MDDTTKRGRGRPRTNEPKPPKKVAKLGEGKQPQFPVSLSPDQKSKLARLAAKAGCTSAEWVRRMIDAAKE